MPKIIRKPNPAYAHRKKGPVIRIDHMPYHRLHRDRINGKEYLIYVDPTKKKSTIIDLDTYQKLITVDGTSHNDFKRGLRRLSMAVRYQEKINDIKKDLKVPLNKIKIETKDSGIGEEED